MLQQNLSTLVVILLLVGHLSTSSKNHAIKWVIAKYVEADNPNSNGQSWSLEDLRMAQPSINYAPMNMLHKSNHIVGAYVANEMIYPTVDDDSESAEEAANPYIETVGAFWRYYFPV